MRRAARLAARGRTTTLPNPVVGCVLLSPDGVAVGEGWHAVAGGPHAEVVALADAGPRARGATAVVTLEPCAHTGRTGPCAQALLDAGVARVVVGTLDPTPAGGGGA
ncbi:MAG: bifunctional diaminohydroxyphosphoribosylaminopyrimidine deaminase/5-amino-6-(5-phosphoribosylamino)uracil reductase RibD, partial [Actinomycetota bacterium]